MFPEVPLGLIAMFLSSGGALSPHWNWFKIWNWGEGTDGGIYSSRGVPLINVPFEEMDPEEKFIVEASKITGLKLSDLDVCQQKIIMRLKSSCGSLNDEDLARLSIHLMNCQSLIEGRKIYECKDSMSLKSCTEEMTPEAWNAYHIISNRARAVCYVARQQHFRAVAEMMVNKLVETTQSHIMSISTFQEKQKALQGVAEVSLDKLSKSQNEALASYNRIRTAENALSTRLNSGLEKAKEAQKFLDSSHKLLTDMMVIFQKGIENSGQQIQQQMKLRLTEQNKLIEEIGSLKKMAVDIKQKLAKLEVKSEEENKRKLCDSESSLE